MATCHMHPGIASVVSLFGKHYCANCKKGIEAARKAVSGHVEPKECFIWYVDGRRGWEPIPGTGCAHWVAHELGIRKVANCLAGYPVRVSDVIGGKSEVKLENVRAGDLYVSADKKHMGLVLKVVKSKTDGEPPAILIRHDSSKQGKVATNDFADYFKSSGTFRR